MLVAQDLQLALHLAIVLMQRRDARLIGGDEAVQLRPGAFVLRRRLRSNQAQLRDAAFGAVGHFMQRSLGGVQKLGALAQNLLRLIDAQVHVAIVGFGAIELRFEFGDPRDMAADRREIMRPRGLRRLHRLFEPPLAHGEFGAQQIALGDDFLHRHRRKHLQPSHRKTKRAPPESGEEHQGEKPGDEEAEREIHRLFDQDAAILDPSQGGRRCGFCHVMTRNAKHELRFVGSRDATATAARGVVHLDDDFPPAGCRTADATAAGVAR